MKDIKDYTTKELVEELKIREGVEMIWTRLEDHGNVTVDNDFDVCVYSARRRGPEIILRITD